MDLSLPPNIQKLIDDRVRTGKYASPEDVIAAALSQLDQQEKSDDFEPGELERLLEAGEASGAPLDGDEVFADMRERRQRGQSKAG